MSVELYIGEKGIYHGNTIIPYRSILDVSLSEERRDIIRIETTKTWYKIRVSEDQNRKDVFYALVRAICGKPTASNVQVNTILFEK